MDDLETIAREIRSCTLCPLSQGRNLAVSGEGPVRARLMLVGEAPGREEDLQVRPFVGRAGTILDRCLRDVGIERKDVFVTNVVKCRPPGNRLPAKSESEVCIAAYPYRQIHLVNPDIVCLLGITATEALLEESRLESVRGCLIEKERRYFVTYHPIAAGRNPA